MAYSGTTNFLLTRDAIIGAALRALEIYGPGDTIPAIDITNCTEALNIILKAWGMQGLNLWTNVDRTLPLISGTRSYTVGPTGASVGNLPLRITDAYVRIGQIDTKVQIISRYDYDTIPDKTVGGIPTQLFYDPTIPNGVINVYPVPNSIPWILHFVSQDAIQDAGAAADNPYIPQEWYQLLKWALADEISLEYGCDSTKIRVAEAKAQALRKDLSDYILTTYGGLDAKGASPRIERA